MKINIHETLGYNLAQACKNHRGKTSELLSSIGLYTGQEMVLSYLSQNDGISQNELVTAMGVQPATITKGLQRLEKSGYIKRKRDRNDARVMIISLTTEGKKIQSSINDVWQRLEEVTFESFTLDEKIIFRRLLLQVIENLEK